MISLHHLSVGYGRRFLIEDASAEFVRSRLIALLGRNGAGKSTLLRAVAGLSKPLGGEVVVDGKNILALTPQERARFLAFVNTERVRVENLRCHDVVAMGRAPYTDWIGRLSAEDERIVEESLRLVGMESYINRPMDRMSDGECQRVMIARALAQDTPIILLDEPTSFLDLPNRYELCLLLAQLAHQQQKTIVFSTHELDIALELADDIALIDSPHLYYLPTPKMIGNGHIDRLFTSTNVTFDAQRRRVILS